MGSATLAKVGDQEVTEREMSDAMQRRLQEVAPAKARRRLCEPSPAISSRCSTR